VAKGGISILLRRISEVGIYPAVSHYMTRVSEVYVKEDGEWKLRSAHWSPVTGGSGTSQSALE
jgi:hypothetical protein